MKKGIFLTALFTLALGIVAFQADAVAYININFVNDGYPNTESYTGVVGGTSYNGAAGTYQLAVQGVVTPVWGFCVDPTYGSFDPSPYNLLPITDSIRKSAAWLANSYQTGLLNTMYPGNIPGYLAAATQTAIWELVLDTGLDVTNGNTKTSSPYAALSQSLVNEASNNHQGFDASGWRWADSVGNPPRQDVLIPNVPIPAAAWLLGSGLVGLVLIRRRMKK